jgi:hypothetical protein
MFFADLTPYEYGRDEPQAHILNIGWLSHDHPFSTGPVSEAFVQMLRRLVAAPVNLYRGSHLCEFCPDPPVFLSPGGLRMIDPPPSTAGNGEIRVVGNAGRIYVAPVLVVHYVEEHKYQPPAEFIAAVVSTNGIASA